VLDVEARIDNNAIDLGVTYSLGLTGDSQLFSIDASTGELSFIDAPDFEYPVDANQDNVYEVTVLASDGTNQSSQLVLVSVTTGQIFTTTENTTNGLPGVFKGGIDASDVDQDGDLDILISGQGTASTFTSLFIQDGQGTGAFTNSGETFQSLRDPAVGFIDINGDGTDELILVGTDLDGDEEAFGAMYNNGQFGWSLNTGVTIPKRDNVSLFVGDVDGDSDEDFQIMGAFTVNVGSPYSPTYQTFAGNTLYRNNELNSGQFSVITAFQDLYDGDISYGDVDGDSDLDAIITGYYFDTPSRETKLYKNDLASSGTFTEDATVILPGLRYSSVELVDVDNDGDADILLAGENSSNQLITKLFINEGEFSGSFSEDTRSTFPGMKDGDIAPLDVDNDGDQDFVLSGQGASGPFSQLFINDGNGVFSPSDLTIPAMTGSAILVKDFNGDGDIDFIVTGYDNSGTNTAILSYFETDSPPAFDMPTSFEIDENTIGNIVNVVGNNGDLGPEDSGITYNLANAEDSELFTINSSTGEISFASAPDFENPQDADQNNVYQVVVTASEGIKTADIILSITVIDLNDSAPEFTSSADLQVNENETSVGSLEVTDADAGSTITLSITGGADAGDFLIDELGQLTFAASPDFEDPKDLDLDNVYEVEVSANDGENSTPQALSVTIQDLNDESPVVTANQSFDLSETASNGIVLGNLIASDADAGTSFSEWAISSGNPDGTFLINATTGTLQLADNSLLDFETSPTIQLAVRVSDGVNTSASRLVTINIQDENDETPVIAPDQSFSISESASVGAAAGTVTASDADANSTLASWQITGGNDQGIFSINQASGQITIADNALLDFETNPGYELSITVSDGVNTSAVQTVQISLVNENDTAPVFSNAGPAAVAEGQVEVIDLEATDADNIGGLIFSIAGGDDQSFFSITEIGGVLSFRTGRDFEQPADADTDNIYQVTVQVTDEAGNTASQSIEVTLEDLNDEFPVFSSNNQNFVAENEMDAATLIATDRDAGSTVAYSITGGVDQARFNVDENTGVLSFVQPPNFEEPADFNGDNEYSIVVTASDGQNTTNASITVEVTDANDAPSDITLSANTLQSYIDPVGTIIGRLATVDEDDPTQSASYIYAIVEGGESFEINSDNDIVSRVVFTNNQDSVATINVSTNDGSGGIFQKDLIIDIEAFVDNEPPQIILNNENPEFFEKGTQSVSIAAEITDNFQLASVSFVYKTFADTDYIRVSLSGDQDVYTQTVTASEVGQSGINYYFEARDPSGQVSVSEEQILPISFPETGENSQKVVFDSQRFGRDIRNYQVVALPYIFAGSSNRLDVIFDEYGGNPDNDLWRMIRWNSANQTLVDMAGSNTVRPGEGYFFIALEQREVEVGSAVLNTNGTINVNRGWNLIGNPFNIDIDWVLVQMNNSLPVGPLRMIDPQDPAAWPESTVLPAFEGAFVFSTEAGQIQLSYLNAAARTAAEYNVPEFEWMVPITLTQGTTKRVGGVGMHVDATHGLDSYDDPTLPRWLEYLEIVFPNEDIVFDRLNRDIVPVSGEASWEFSVASSQTGRATLEWPIVDSNMSLKLLDIKTGRIIDMLEQNSLMFDLEGERHFKLMYSSDPGQLFVGERIVVNNAYPNPTSGDFEIPIQLPEQDGLFDVEVKVMDMSGKVLFEKSEKHKTGMARVYVSLDEEMGAGLYFYEIKVTHGKDVTTYREKIILK
jgi:VCBS repeat-containing protein